MTDTPLPPWPVSVRARRAFSALALLGAAAFGVGLTIAPTEAWTVFLVNFLFWSGMAVAGVLFAAILELSTATWAGPVRRVAESFVAFLPVSAALFLVFAAGAGVLYGWMADPPPARAIWFRPGAFWARLTIALALLYGLGLTFVLASRRGAAGDTRWAARTPALAVWFTLVYAAALSVVAIDLVMSLDPHWTSTLFPGYFFIGNLYAGLGAVTLACALQRRATGVAAWFDEDRAYDLGRLLLGFSLLWTYLFWSQFLVIWYGNLPEEFGFLVDRTEGPWAPVAWTVLALCFVAPFLALLSRETKRPHRLVYVAGAAAAGVWLERLLLVAPSTHAASPLLWLAPPVTIGFLALFVLTQATVPLWLSRYFSAPGGSHTSESGKYPRQPNQKAG